MSLHIIETSPLKAAREWRGISLPIAARSSAITCAQAEALEQGDVAAFETIEEMVATAVLYTACLGIGRDEAMALLDRTLEARLSVSESAAGHTPDIELLPGFSSAVKNRSRAIASRNSRPLAHVVLPSVNTASSPTYTDLPVTPLTVKNHPTVHEVTTAEPLGAEIVEETVPRAYLGAAIMSVANSVRGAAQVLSPDETGEMTRVPADGAASVIHSAVSIDQGYRDALALSEAELEAWTVAHTTRRPGLIGTVSAHIDAASRTVLGDRRTDIATAKLRNTRARAREMGEQVRQYMRESEQSTLIVAVLVGIVVLSALVAVSSVLSDSPPSKQSSSQGGPQISPPAPDLSDELKAQESAGNTATPEKTAPATSVKKAPAVLPTTKVTVSVMNAGSTKGKAAELAQRLKGMGYTIGTVGNAPSKYGTSVILFPSRFEAEAQRLSRQTNISTLDTIPNSGAATTANITIIFR